MYCWRRIEKRKWSDKMTNEVCPEHRLSQENKLYLTHAEKKLTAAEALELGRRTDKRF